MRIACRNPLFCVILMYEIDVKFVYNFSDNILASTFYIYTFTMGVRNKKQTLD